MTPTNFPEANKNFAAPPDMEESQVGTIPAYMGTAIGGNIDGIDIAVVAWKPNEEELAELNAGGNIYVTMLNILPAHTLQTSFYHATHF